MNRLGLMSSFAAVVKAGSFTRAAEHLLLSKSVVSRHVSRLEHELGVQLLYRSTHGLSLTEAGERFFRHCKDLEALADEAVASAISGKETPHGLLRVTLSQILVMSPVGRLFGPFQEAYPEIELDVRVTSFQIDPVEEGFDVALRLGTPKDSDLVSRKIRDARLQAVAAPSYVKRHGSPGTPAELSGHNCLIFSEFGARALARSKTSGERARSRTKIVAGARNLALSGKLSTNSAVLLLESLLAGHGVAIGPDLMFEPYVRQRRLRVLVDEVAREPRGLFAVFPHGRFPSASRRVFVEFLIAHLGNAQGNGAARRALSR